MLPTFISRRTGPLLLAAALLGGCSTRPVEDSLASPPPTQPARPAYSAATLADLLVAEVAAQRNLLGVTLGYYSREARAHRDPLVAEQAARLAAYLNQPAEAAELGAIWLAGQPDSQEARELLAMSDVRLGDSEAAAAHIDVLLDQQPDQALMRLVAQARDLDQQGNETLLQALASLSEKHPRQAPLWYARALHLQQQAKLPDALAACEKALSLQPEHEDALLLKARLLYQLERREEALRHLQRLVKRYPDAKRVRVLLVRLLLQDGRREQASEQLAILTERYPDDQELRFSLALFGLEQGARDEASATLQALLEEGFRPDDMHLYLARAAELDGDPDAAIDHYLQVGDGERQLQARVQAARLLYSSGQTERGAALMARLRDQAPDQMPALYVAEADMLNQRRDFLPAMALLNGALETFPDSVDLLYARAMTAEKLGNLAQLEADLRRMLELEPDDPTALNALGYTLTDRTDRHEEAYDYIERALAQRPDDPAIMDSMGWVLFRLGRPDEALPWLQKAWQAFPDPEVASHLGEVLWVLGQQEEARRVWQDAMTRKPDNPLVPATVERLTGSPTP